MKTRIFPFIFILAILCLAACTPESEGMKVNPKTCLKVISAYYPYTEDENFVFVNEELGRTCKAKAFKRTNDESYPYVRIMDCRYSPAMKCYGDWSVDVFAALQETESSSDQALSGYIQTNVFCSPDDKLESVALFWYVQLNVSDGGSSQCHCDILCFSEDLYKHFTDTIVLPLNSPEGAYARIVKNQGLTDFSVDGKTVWKRVK